MSKIVTFGEVMLRLQPPGYQRFSQARSFDATYGGAEANVAVSLAALGEQAVFFTKIVGNPIGDACLTELRARGVSTEHIIRGGDRMGIYYCEKGASQRASKVVYDRKDSAVNTICENDIDYDALFDGADWFHFSGITPALSELARAVTFMLVSEAKNRGIKISIDLNYRKNLWTTEEAGAVMSELIPFADYLISNEEECKSVLSLSANGSDVTGGVLSKWGYTELGRTVLKHFPNLKAVAFTLRTSISASVNGWTGVLVEKANSFWGKEYTMQIVDRVGGGDAFSAGLIYGLLHEHGEQGAIEFAVASSCLKHSIEGDFNHISLEEINSLLQGDASGRVVR